MKNVFITGGAGYVGSRLVPLLLEKGYQVTVFDLLIYGSDVLPTHENLKVIQGDIRNRKLLESSIPGYDAVIHLACISNDPSFELDPELGKSINYDAFEPLVQIAKDGGVKLFIYASSSSVYGIKEEDNVTEDLSLEPLTDYSKYKALCEEILLKYQSTGFTTVIIRPATVCGYAPRLRLDLTVNILTNHGYHNGKIKVFGGTQRRPNINIDDMVDLYINLLRYPDEKIAGKIYNAGYQNHTVMEIAEIVKRRIGYNIPIEVVPTTDNRSYHISSEKIKRELGFKPSHSIENAVDSLISAFKTGLVKDPFSNPMYYNIKRMQEIQLK